MSGSWPSGDRHWAFGIAALVAVVLYATAPAIGYARDEGFYFQSATEYGRWLDLLWQHPAQALTRQAVDAHFRINAEHPSLIKLLLALSHRLLYEVYHVIPTPGLAFRLPGILMSALATGLVVLWGSRAVSRSAGVVAGISFIAMPRVFHHAHLACFDMPVVAMILLTAYAYSMAVSTRRWPWIVAVGFCYGLALDTKHNAWTLPAVLSLHCLVTERANLWRGSATQRLRSLLPILSMLTIGPLVLFALWPWLWFDTLDRLRYWVEFHLHHEYYNMEFLGRTYHRPPMPRGYAWVMTFATVPLTTLLLAGVGLFASLRYAVRGAFGSVPLFGRVATGNAQQSTGQGEVVDGHRNERRSTDLLWLMGLLSGYAPWWFTTTPIFGGTKHWLPAYPFLCLFVARGFGVLMARLCEEFPSCHAHPWRRVASGAGVSLVCLSAPLAITLDSWPFGLSAYTPIVGGAPGAATLGLNRTFWGYTSIEMAEKMSELLPHGGRVFIHDTAFQSWDMHQRDGTFARQLTPTLSAAQSSVALYHYEPHMGRVEYQIWEAYGTTTPAAVTTFHGVPVLWLYARPEVMGSRK
jgi:4-amino-4-deoxy-L-arabinose transferase-like glycosyltransferase